MKNKIIFVFLALSLSLKAMEMDDGEIQQITDQVQNAARYNHEKKIKDLLQHQPFKENPDYLDFLELADVCTPHYAPLLKKLLEKKIVSPNTSLSSDGMTVNLLSEAIHFGIYSSKNYTPKNRLNVVKVLLDAGSYADKACVPHDILSQFPPEWNKIYKDCIQTPLSKAITMGDRELALLLLQRCVIIKDNMCKEMTPLMEALQRYVTYKKAFGMNDSTIDLYKMVELLVKYGADVHIPSKHILEKADICTPMQLASKNGLKEIITLFEQYQSKKP